MANKQLINPMGAFGYTDLDQQLYQETGTFKASAAVTAKRVVAIGTDGRVAVAATNGTAALAIGVSNQTIASGASGNVVLGGIVTGVAAAGAIAAGDVVKRSATTAGFVSTTASPATGEAIGIAIAASASNTVSLFIINGK